VQQLPDLGFVYLGLRSGATASAKMVGGGEGLSPSAVSVAQTVLLRGVSFG
jgi:hypothetical protein